MRTIASRNGKANATAEAPRAPRKTPRNAIKESVYLGGCLGDLGVSAVVFFI
jgi:hypothetical protein